AVIFSGMATATAFGSLWLSSDPGMSSMGKLMALALLCTMAAAVLFQPALMGRPREKPKPGPERPIDIRVPAPASRGAPAAARRPASPNFEKEPALAGARESQRTEEDELRG